MMVSIALHFIFLLLLAPPVCCHQEKEKSSGCCGDIPDSLIWFLSFIILIGLVIIISSYYMYPDPNYKGGVESECSREPTVVRIYPGDLRNIAKLIHDNSNSV